MSERTRDRGQAVIWVILTAVIAGGLFLIIKNSAGQPISPAATISPTETPTISTTPTVIPTPTIATDEQIDSALKSINDQAKSVDESLNDTPIDVMK